MQDANDTAAGRVASTANARATIGLEEPQLIFAPPDRCFTFDIPEEWWAAAGMATFKRVASAYPSCPDPCRPTLPVVSMPIASIRRGRRTREGGDFDRERMVKVLCGIANGERIPPVAVIALPNADGEQFSHRLYDGFHRFSASLAVGYTEIPVVIVSEA